MCDEQFPGIKVECESHFRFQRNLQETRQLFLDRQQRLGFLQPRRQATILLLDEDMIPVPALIASAVLRWLVYTEISAGWIEARKKEIPIQHGRRTGTIGCVENVARHRKKD